MWQMYQIHLMTYQMLRNVRKNEKSRWNIRFAIYYPIWTRHYVIIVIWWCHSHVMNYEWTMMLWWRHQSNSDVIKDLRLNICSGVGCNHWFGSVTPGLLVVRRFQFYQILSGLISTKQNVICDILHVPKALWNWFLWNLNRLEWVWDGDVEVGFKWTRKWVEKGEMVFPRTGHVSGIINGGDIWSCGGATSGEINPDTEQVT